MPPPLIVTALVGSIAPKMVAPKATAPPLIVRPPDGITTSPARAGVKLTVVPLLTTVPPV